MKEYLKQHYCIDCNKKIWYRTWLKGTKRCSSCALKYSFKIGKSEERTGKNNNMYKDGRCSKQYYCKEKGCNNKICMITGVYGQGKCHSCASKLRWKNKEFREKTIKASMKGSLITPNKPEKCINKLLNKLFLKEYSFVGDGKLIVGGFCPDFVNVNGQKKIIELYGNYWHKKQEVIKRDKRRIKTYKKYGYKTLIIWEHELKDLDKVKRKIKEFHFD